MRILYIMNLYLYNIYKYIPKYIKLHTYVTIVTVCAF